MQPIPAFAPLGLDAEAIIFAQKPTAPPLSVRPIGVQDAPNNARGCTIANTTKRFLSIRDKPERPSRAMCGNAGRTGTHPLRWHPSIKRVPGGHHKH